MKEYGESRIRLGEKCLVVDLAACTGMDSTFMGTLAGLASRISEKEGVVQVAEPGDKNRNSLEDLGLDFLMEVDPAETVWKDVAAQARDLLKPKVAGMKAGTTLHTRHILEAHQILSDASDENREKFSKVLEALGEQLGEKTEGPR